MTELTLRALTASDVAAVQQLLEADAGYAERVTGRPLGPNAARDLLEARPPTLSLDDKVVLGVFGDSQLVAVVDLLRGWPQAGTVHVGLLQVHALHQRRGVGRQVHDLALRWLEAWPEATQLRAAIVETNIEQAAPFWQALGYTPSGAAKPYFDGTLHTTVRIWTRPKVSSR